LFGNDGQVLEVVFKLFKGFPCICLFVCFLYKRVHHFMLFILIMCSLQEISHGHLLSWLGPFCFLESPPQADADIALRLGHSLSSRSFPIRLSWASLSSDTGSASK
jgi:hypothetical protein